MIKRILFDALFFLYCITACAVIILCMLLPFPIVHDDLPTWLIILISIAGFTACITQKYMLDWFINNGILD